MKKYIFTFMIAFMCWTLKAQQLSSWSSYYESGFVWNPALTAKWNSNEVAVTHRQDWIGFEGAPQYTNISFQHPFISGYHTKSALGVFMERDKVGLRRKSELPLRNYRFRPQFLAKEMMYWV
ncbi:MAG: type IX secretion system membrane protein PorP/SprF [Saprospiraceae bacterium]|nr:type IX secretion system membrane protein PorP/SprF [Saprospiraceae bacterium]